MQKVVERQTVEVSLQMAKVGGTREVLLSLSGCGSEGFKARSGDMFESSGRGVLLISSG